MPVELREPAVAWRIPLARYHEMVDGGLLGEDDRVELIEGVLVAMSPKGPEHDAAVEWLTERFVTELAGRASVRVQSALTFSGLDSEPEPDLVVVARDAPRPRHPSAALLVVEVAVSSLSYDRRVKAPLYARAGVPEYWIVDLADEAVERFRDPGPEGYASVERLAAGATLEPAFSGAPAVAVDALLDFALRR